MSDCQNIFNKAQYRANKNRYAAQFAEVDFLHCLAQMRIIERLECINRKFERVLIYGAPNDLLASHAKLGEVIFADIVARKTTCVIYDDEFSPLQDGSFDAIISLLHLHHSNDLAGSLIQMKRALRPDGLLLCAIAGVHSLRELRQSLAYAEMRSGGVSPRVAPFMDIRDAGALLQRAGLKLPVVDDEIVNLSYENMFALMQELRNAGEANVMFERRKNFTTKRMFMDATEFYANNFIDDEGRIMVTAHLLFLTAWKEHISQQQPQKRGSGKISLGDVL